MKIEKFLQTYLDMESYGASLIIKKYTGFPRFLPLPAHIEHGVEVPFGSVLSFTDVFIAGLKPTGKNGIKQDSPFWAKK